MHPAAVAGGGGDDDDDAGGGGAAVGWSVGEEAAARTEAMRVLEELDALEMSMQESLNGFYGQLRTLQVEERKKVEAELRMLEANIAQWEKEGDGAGGADDGARELSSTIAKLKQQLASGAATATTPRTSCGWRG